MSKGSAPLKAYQGDQPFIFVSYSHKDADTAYKELRWLSEEGFNVWFDEGINPGNRWTDELAAAIERSAVFLYFVTPNSVVSDHCRNEVQFATARTKPILSVHLEETELPPGLELSIANHQAIMKNRHNKQDYQSRLRQALADILGTRSGPVHVSDSQPKEPRRQNSWLIAGAAITVVVLLGILFWPRGSEQQDDASLAVLPFDNYSDPTRSYLANGLAEGLIGQLGRVANLRVSSRASSFALKNELSEGAIKVSDIPDRLGVQYIVEGSLISGDTADNFHVTARLIDTLVDTVVWTDQWEAETYSLVDIQAEIAIAVAEELLEKNGNVSAADGPSAAPITSKPLAYDPYLQGREYLRLPTTPESVASARAQFTAALDVDPQFPQAYAGLCEAHLDEYGLNKDSLPFALAQRACNRALELQPDLWEVNLSLAELYRSAGDYDRSLEAVTLALNAAPEESSVHSALAETLTRQGKILEAESSFLRAIELDPGYWGTYMDLGNFYYDRVEYDKALQVYQSILDMVGDSTNVSHSIGAVQIAMGDFDDAIETFLEIQAQRQSPTRTPLSNIGTAYYYKGCFAESAYWQRAALNLAPGDHITTGRLAEACRFVEGQEPAARTWWERAIELANTQQNQADWNTKGLLGVYHAHLHEFDAADQALQEMWQLNPEDSIAHFYAAIVESEKGLNPDLSIDKSLRAGFPIALIENDPDLRPLIACDTVLKPRAESPCEPLDK